MSISFLCNLFKCSGDNDPDRDICRFRIIYQKSLNGLPRTKDVSLFRIWEQTIAEISSWRRHTKAADRLTTTPIWMLVTKTIGLHSALSVPKYNKVQPNQTHVPPMSPELFVWVWRWGDRLCQRCSVKRKVVVAA